SGIVHRAISPSIIRLPFKEERRDVAHEIDFEHPKLDLLTQSRFDDLLPPQRPDVRAVEPIEGFTAPELFNSTLNSKPSADVYSLGALLYFTLAGAAPITAPTWRQLKKATQSEAYQPMGSIRHDVSTMTAEIIHTCLQKNPFYRYADAGKLLAELVNLRRRL